MRAVCQALGLARLSIQPLQVRSGSWINARTRRTPLASDALDEKRAWEGRGPSGEPVCEMLIEAVEKRFGDVEGVPDTHVLEVVSDNGRAYIAAETRQIARQLGLEPVNTPVCNPQSNGIAIGLEVTFG